MTREKVEHDEECWVYNTLFQDLRLCGCGQYYARLYILKEVLNACPLYEIENRPEYLGTPIGEWFLCLLDGAGIIEHGSSIGGSWLTPKGERLRDAMNNQDIWKAIDNDTMGLCDSYPECVEEKK